MHAQENAVLLRPAAFRADADHDAAGDAGRQRVETMFAERIERELQRIRAQRRRRFGKAAWRQHLGHARASALFAG